MSDEMTEQAEAMTEVTQPIIVDLGKQKAKRIKALKRGSGKLWDEVVDVIEEVKVSLGEDADGKTLVPVILVYRKKPRRSNRNFPLLPLS